jgi:glutathionylspermidine synthase
MHRELVAPRPDWMGRVEEVGFTYHSAGKPPVGEYPGVFWDESVCYRFSLDEVEAIEAATEELHRICLKAVDHVCANPHLMDNFGIPKAFQPYIVKSWKRRDPYIKGRFDLAFDPKTKAVKMLEYNADTPTLAIETSVVQWFWMEEVKSGADQFNSLHEKLIERYREIAAKLPPGAAVTFSGLDQFEEEKQHVRYFQDLAQQAGVQTVNCPVQQIGWDSARKRFVDLEERVINFLSPLYPWEWLVEEEFGSHLLDDRVGMLEPVWKMILSNKAILALLWHLNPGHPNLLAAYLEDDNPLVKAGRYIAKPILAREGNNISLVRPGEPTIETPGPYESRKVYQEVAPLPSFDGKHVVIGSWVVGEQAAGMILREGDGPVVVSNSRVVPHYFVD